MSILVAVIVVAIATMLGFMEGNEKKNKDEDNGEEVEYIKTIKVLPAGLSDDPEVEYLYTIEA